MITCDSNVLIHAAKYHAGIRSVQLPFRHSAALLLARNRKTTLRVPDVCIGELVSGSVSDNEAKYILILIDKLKTIEVKQIDMNRSLKMNRLLKRGTAATTDGAIYLCSSRNRASSHYTFDKRFSKQTDRIYEITSSYFDLQPAIIKSPLQEYIMRKRNPSFTLFDDPEVKAHRARAKHRAKALGFKDPISQMKFFQAIARAYGFKQNKRPSH